MIALNIVEMFFFVSLAMTFILILLIVYHFKQRISLLEQKNDTIFEIINNLLQRVGDLNKYQCVLSNTISNGNFMKNSSSSKCIPEVFTENVESLVQESKNIILNHQTIEMGQSVSPNSNIALDSSEVVIGQDPLKLFKGMNEKITVSDADDTDDDTDADDDDTDYDTDDNSDAYDSDNDDDSEDEDYDGDKNKKYYKNIDELSNKAIKIVNIELKDIENHEIVIDDLEKKNIKLENNVIEEDNVLEIEKIEVNMENNETIENNNVLLKENLKEIYNKMSVQELKKVVITKGLCSDSSKLKKNELIKMLEES